MNDEESPIPAEPILSEEETLRQLQADRDKYNPLAIRLQAEINTLEIKRHEELLQRQELIDLNVKLRVLLHEFALNSMRIRTELSGVEEDDLTGTERKWLEEVRWLINAAKEYPLTKQELEAWEAKKKAKRWSES